MYDFEIQAVVDAYIEVTGKTPTTIWIHPRALERYKRVESLHFPVIVFNDIPIKSSRWVPIRTVICTNEVA